MMVWFGLVWYGMVWYHGRGVILAKKGVMGGGAAAVSIWLCSPDFSITKGFVCQLMKPRETFIFVKEIGLYLFHQSIPGHNPEVLL